MKCFKFIFTLLYLIASVHADSNDDAWVVGQPMRNVRNINEFQVNQYATCSRAANGAKYCTSIPGCSHTSVFQCFNGYPLPETACPETAKYCDGGSCVSVPPNACKPEFVCPTAGYFPKYDDCSVYYYCYFDNRLNNLISLTRVCPIGYSFSPLGPLNRVCQRNSTCVTASCTAGKLAEWKTLNYPGFTENQIALYCSNGQPIRIDSCSNGQSIDLNIVNGRSCSVKCLTDYQKAVYDYDYKWYFNCLDGYSYPEQCEYGEVFDPKTLNCITSPNRIVTTTMAGFD